MNLWLRLLWLLLTSPFKARLQLPEGVSRLEMRVMPNDLDTNVHMNNGRFFTLMDLGRMDLLFRGGATWTIIRRRMWAPVLGAVQMRFRLPLDLWQKFTLETRLLCWDAQWFYIEQRFIIGSGPRKGAVAAIGLLRGGFYDGRNKRVLQIEEMMTTLRLSIQSPAEPDFVTIFKQSEDSMKGLTAK
jgi:acyl-CoA thioesterase FadM